MSWYPTSQRSCRPTHSSTQGDIQVTVAFDVVGDGLQVSARTGATIPGCWLYAGHLGGEPTTSSICCIRLPRCHWDKNYTWQKELRSHWSNNLEQSSGRSATPLAVTVVIWTKTEAVFVWAMNAPEEFCLSRAIQMFALLLLLLLLLLLFMQCISKCGCHKRHDIGCCFWEPGHM